MTEREFLAAAAFAPPVPEAGEEAFLLVLDPESGGGCLLSREKTKSYQVRQLLCPDRPEGETLLTLLQQYFGASPLDARQVLAKVRQEQAGKVLKRFYRSDRMLDGEILTFGGKALTCTGLEALLRDRVLAWQQALTPAAALSPENLGILVLGSLPYALEYALRELLSGDPLLPDDRFTFLPESSREKILAAGRSLGAAWSLILKTTGGEREIPLGSPEDTPETLCTPVYFGPVLLGRTLVLSRDGAHLTLELPVEEQGSVSDIGLTVEEGRACLCLRSSLAPDRVRRQVLPTL